MAERLAGGNVAVALLANTIATGAALFTFAGIRSIDAPAFIAAQIVVALAAAFVFHWLIPKEKE